MMLSNKLGLAALVAVWFAAPAAAAPLPVASTAAIAGAAVETVAYGCGPGFSPNAWGYCRPAYRGYGYYGPRRYGYGYGYARPGFSVGLPGARLSFY